MDHWFQYFPGNFMWSQGMMFAIEMTPWGAAALGEIDQVGKRLKAVEGDNAAWFREWEKLAERIEKDADLSLKGGHLLTAGSNYLRAAVYHFCGERFLPPGEQKNNAYRRTLHCFSAGAKYRYPMLERVEVPYEGKTLPGYLLKAEGGGRKPAMVIVNGLDTAKELVALFAGVEIMRRGIHALIIDGPGQGESLRLRNIPSRHDYEVPATAALDFLAKRDDIAADRVGVMGISLGGYYAPRAAAMQSRFKACVAWGAQYSYYGVWRERWEILQRDKNKSSAPNFQLPWVLGVPDMAAAMEKLVDFTLEGVAEKIRCPFLIVHGEKDTIVPLETARRLHDAVSSKVKELKVFTMEQGGSEHCQIDNRQLGANYIADWLADHL